MHEEAVSLVDTLDEIPELRPFPVVATRVLAVCNSEDADVMDLAEVMQCDPAMSLRLLRTANSAHYGYSGEIASVEHAIVVLGFRAVRNLALSVSALSLFRDGKTGGDVREKLWQHSLGCAAVARQLAPHVSRITPDEAFLAGIMHDIGKLVFIDLALDDYLELSERCDVATIIDAENCVFGVTHEQIGERCGMEWGLPPEINSAIRHHHAPQESNSDNELVSIISVADYLAHAWSIGDEHAPTDVNVSDVPQTDLSIDSELLEEVRNDAPAEFEVLRKSCVE